MRFKELLRVVRDRAVGVEGIEQMGEEFVGKRAKVLGGQAVWAWAFSRFHLF